MKKFLVIVLFLLSFAASAQTEQGSATLFNSSTDPTVVNCYFSFDGSLTQANDKTVWGLGGTLGSTVNHVFSIGLAGQFIVDPTIPDEIYSLVPPGYVYYNIKKYYGYGGLLLEPTFFSKFPIHLTVPVVVGAGGVSYYMSETAQYWTTGQMKLQSESFFVLTVGARVELNVIKKLRISCGPTWRYAPTYEPLNQLALDFSIKLGAY